MSNSLLNKLSLYPKKHSNMLWTEYLNPLDKVLTKQITFQISYEHSLLFKLSELLSLFCKDS
jgi:hypothetical protein